MTGFDVWLVDGSADHLVDGPAGYFVEGPAGPEGTADMWRNVRPRVAHLSPLERVRLRRVAMRYALHHWPVTPGACLANSRFVCVSPKIALQNSRAMPSASCSACASS